MPNDVVRFPSQLPYDKWPAASQAYSMMINGEWAALPAFFDAHRQDITDSIGAGNWWRDQYQPAAPVPTKPAMIGTNETLPWFKSPNGQVNVTTATGDGKVSASAGSGGVPCWISLAPTFPDDEKRTSYGAGATGYLSIAASQKFYFKQMGGTDQDMRASIESVG